MATVNFFVSAKKIKLAPIYVRLSAGRTVDLIVKSGLIVEPRTWSNKTQTLRQRDRSEDDEKFIKKLTELRVHIENETKLYGKDFTKEWLTAVIYRFHHNKDEDAKNLNEFIERFLTDAEAGLIKNRSGRNLAIGTARGLRGFQLAFNEYQGNYTPKREKARREANKALRPRIEIDFDDVTIDFYNAFKNYLTDEGYKLNTIGRFIKQLKYFMARSLAEKKHTNREFKERAFSGMTEDVFTVYLTPEEVEKIYKYDLSNDKRMDIARDKFIVLCETALRVSDYDKIDLNIRMNRGRPFIYLYQTKTADPVVIPLTRRMEEILDKYDGHLPKIPEQYVNQYIKTIAFWCGIDEVLNWEVTTYGKRHPKTARKWKLITCHTGRRTAASNMYHAGIKVLDIMRITGHRTEKSFLNYIRLTNEDVAYDLSTHPYYTGETLKVAN